MKFRFVFIAVLFIVPLHELCAQVTISGTTCVVSGGELGYLYTATGNQQSNDQLTWKVTGGVIAGTTNTSFNATVGATGAQVRVIWNKGVSNGKLMLTNGRLGVTETTVTIISFPNTISLNATALRIGNTVTIGGSGAGSTACSPLSSYWWEWAPASAGPFAEIENATDKNLVITISAGKKYYRRVLAVNGDQLYSNIISIDPQ